MKRFLKKVKGIFTARPNIVLTSTGGEITIKNVDADTVAKVKALLVGSLPAGEESPPLPMQEALPTIENKSGDASLEGSPLTSVAVGRYQHPLTLNWHIVT